MGWSQQIYSYMPFYTKHIVFIMAERKLKRFYYNYDVMLHFF